jgi:hypothetical protein
MPQLPRTRIAMSRKKILTAALLSGTALASAAAADDDDGGGPRSDPLVPFLRSILEPDDAFRRGYWGYSRDGRFRTYRYIDRDDDDDDDGGRSRWRSGDDDD